MPVPRRNMGRLEAGLYRSNTVDRNYTLFTGGADGGVYDPPDYCTLLQDSAGTVPITAIEQPVGLMLDKSGRRYHATQPVANSRPLLGAARVNLLAPSQDIDLWEPNGQAVNANAMVAPDGTTTAETSSSATGTRFKGCVLVAGFTYSYSLFVKPADPTKNVRLYGDGGGVGTFFLDIQPSTGAISTLSGTATAGSIAAVGAGWYRVQITFVPLATGTQNVHVYPINADLHGWWGAQVNLGSSATRYQRVNTPTDYATVGFPHYLKFDGVDDFMTAPGGGGTQGFFFCGAVRILATQTHELFANVGANAGYLVRVASDNHIAFYAGYGQGYLQASTPDVITLGAVSLVTAWDDGVNLNVQLDNGPVIPAARPATVLAGPTTCSVGTAFGGYLNGHIYPYVYFRNSAGTAGQRATAQAWARSRAGL